MNKERWDEVKTSLSAKFPVVASFEEPFDFMGSRGVRDVLELKTPAGRLRAMLETRPRVAGKEFHYTHRPGDSARETFVLSEDEVVHQFKVLKEDEDGEWVPIAPDSFM